MGTNSRNAEVFRLPYPVYTVNITIQTENNAQTYRGYCYYGPHDSKQKTPATRL